MQQKTAYRNCGTLLQAVQKARQTASFSAEKRSLPARRAAKSVRKALLRKAAETDVHAAGFGSKISGLFPAQRTIEKKDLLL